MTAASPFTVAVEARSELGEGPLWSPEEQALYWVDITPHPALNRLDPATGHIRRLPMPEDISCIGLAAGGGLVAGFRSGLWLLNERGERVRQLAPNPEDTRTSRLNDGRVAPDGRFWVGTIDQSGGSGAAHLYRYDERGLMSFVDRITISNGLAFSPDGRWMYHTDTPSRIIKRYALDPNSGDISDPQDWVRIEPRAGDKSRHRGGPCRPPSARS